jgi:leucyl/phenylalanyl-tRNA--protein transferase
METFTARDLLACYARGVFPMADARDDARVFLIDPERRGVIPLDDFYVSRRLARTVRRDPFEVRIDTAFPEVVALCAEAAPDRTETWINGPIERLYGELHSLGFAHSVECWRGDELVGGLYGVALKGAFFGESMFSRATDASKVALVHLVARLIAGGFVLLDTQFMTEHLSQFGTQEISRRDYHRRLKAAMTTVGAFQALGAAGVSGAAVGAAGVGDTSTGGLAADLGAAGLGAAGLTAGGLAGAGATGAAAATGVTGAVALQLINQAS